MEKLSQQMSNTLTEMAKLHNPINNIEARDQLQAKKRDNIRRRELTKEKRSEKLEENLTLEQLWCEKCVSLGWNVVQRLSKIQVSAKDNY